MRPAESRKRLSKKQTQRVRIGAMVLFICISFLLVRNVWWPYFKTSRNKFHSVLTDEELQPLKQLPGINFRNPYCRDFHSQHGEDVQLFLKYWAFPKIKRDGVFLEIGAFDGVGLSNSVWFEKCLGWTGVLIEGQPEAAKLMRKNRPNTKSFEAAACDRDEGNVTFVGKADGLSGDAKQMPKDFIWAIHKGYYKGEEEVHTVQCRLISSMLREAEIDHIDFWTLDVEGAELTVLSTFDWEKVAVHVLVIENDKNEKDEYERRHNLLTATGGMQYVGPLFNNELWINPDYQNITLLGTSKQS